MGTPWNLGCTCAHMAEHTSRCRFMVTNVAPRTQRTYAVHKKPRGRRSAWHIGVMHRNADWRRRTENTTRHAIRHGKAWEPAAHQCAPGILCQAWPALRHILFFKTAFLLLLKNGSFSASKNFVFLMQARWLSLRRMQLCHTTPKHTLGHWPQHRRSCQPACNQASPVTKRKAIFPARCELGKGPSLRQEENDHL